MDNAVLKSNIFLSRSYQDAWSDYQYSLTSFRASVWDWVIVTASNGKQADAYRLQIEERLHNHFLPAKTKYAVISDPDGKRVGSGGATLNGLKYIWDHSDAADANPLDAKILIIHSGGDSKRIPQYSACGKLFSPVPRLLPDGRRSTLFDELIISVISLPSRMNNGMLVMSGDALLLFNSLQVDLKLNKGAVALSTRETLKTGVNHGVFLCDSKRCVSKFLHKQSEEALKKTGAADQDGYVDLDTGTVWFDSNILKDLLLLIEDEFDAFVNDNVRLSFYGDFLYPLADNSSYDGYMGSEGEIPLNDKLLRCRQRLWEILRKYKLSIIRMSPSKFIHFGTTNELHGLMTEKLAQYSYLNWSKNVLSNIDADKYSVNNSYIDKTACIGENCYIEDSHIGENVTVGENTVLSGMTIKNAAVPSGIAMHCLETEDGKHIVRIYGINDNPKKAGEGSFLCGTLSGFIDKTGIKEGALWNTALYPVCDTVEEAVRQALIVYKISNGTVSGDEIKKWSGARRVSLEESFKAADTNSIFRRKKNLENMIRAEQFINALENRTDVEEAALILSNSGIRADQMRLLLNKADNYTYSLKMRIYSAISYIAREKNIDLPDMDYAYLEDMCYDTLNNEINDAMRKTSAMKKSITFIKDEAVMELPARVNFGGGWSDTPPHCTENGGTVLNAAISLRSSLPIKVAIKKLSEKVIRIESVDLDYRKEFTVIEQLLNYSNLNDPFVIVKSALIITGIISHDEESLDALLNRLGGGIDISVSVDIPKGSGLGTSSILAGGCIRAISEIFGLDYDIDTIYSQVLCLEQMIKTGGGWQDQVGGLTNGIKLIKSRPGTVQKLDAEHISMTDKAAREFNERFVLVYSGQQRLAKNILREVMNKYILSNKQVPDILYEIQRIAVLMKFELEKGNITAFAGLLNRHLELSKQLDKGSTNICIDQIFDVCDDLIDGRCVCGAGGGGFVQMILKKGVTRNDLKKRLSQVFQNSGVEVWDCEFV